MLWRRKFEKNLSFIYGRINAGSFGMFNGIGNKTLYALITLVPIQKNVIKTLKNIDILDLFTG